MATLTFVLTAKLLPTVSGIMLYWMCHFAFKVLDCMKYKWNVPQMKYLTANIGNDLLF